MSARVSGVYSEVDPAHLEHPVLAHLKSYWASKRGSRAMPSRAEIKPAEMKEHLGWVVLLDVLPGYADFRYRMIGSRVSEQLLGGFTGKLISEAFAEYGQTVVNAVLAVHRKASRDCIPVRSFGSASALGREFLDYDALILPLSDDGIHANMILNTFTFTPSEAIRARTGEPPAV
jgi:hypothetical protein